MFLSGRYIVDLGGLLCYAEILVKLEKKWKSRESELE